MDKYINPDQKKFLLSLTPKELTFELLCDMFAHKRVKTDSLKPELGDVKFLPTDMMTLMPTEYFNNSKLETTVGKFIYNKYMIEGLGLEEIVGYVNWELTDSGNRKVEGILSAALTNDLIDVAKYADYIDQRDWFGEIMHFPIACSFTSNILKTPKEVTDLRDKLFKENREKLDSGDIFTAEKIEKATLTKAKEILKDDPGMDLYNSGARGSFNNNYKNINIMKGPVYNNITGKYDIIETSHMEGMKKENIDTFGNSIISGAYPMIRLAC